MKYNRVPLGFDPSVARLLGHDPTPRPTCEETRTQQRNNNTTTVIMERKLMDYIIFRSKPVRRKVSDKQNLKKQIKELSPLLPVIDELKDLSVQMASKEDITDMVKYHKTRKAFEPQSFGGKTRENAK